MNREWKIVSFQTNFWGKSFFSVLFKKHQRELFLNFLFSTFVPQRKRSNLVLKTVKCFYEQKWASWTGFISVHFTTGASFMHTKINCQTQNAFCFARFLTDRCEAVLLEILKKLQNEQTESCQLIQSLKKEIKTLMTVSCVCCTGNSESTLFFSSKF